MPIEKRNNRNQPQINDSIRVPKVRAIDSDGK